MIAVIQGKILEKTLHAVIVDTGGVGYEVVVPVTVLAEVGDAGDAVRLYTHLDVREDALTLYGFRDREQLALFRTLITVAGVGPKLAVALLSRYAPAELVAAITAQDERKLTAVSGLGKKTAHRIFLEIGEKLARAVGVPFAAGPGGVAGAGPWREAAESLTSLGLKPWEVTDSLAAAKKAVGEEAGLQAILQAALRSRGPRPIAPGAAGGGGEGGDEGAKAGRTRRRRR